MSVKQINELILTSDLTNADITSIIDAIKYVRSRNARINIASFRIGDKVKFTSNRSNQTVTGTVRKVAIKNIVVDTALGAYCVPASMLTAA